MWRETYFDEIIDLVEGLRLSNTAFGRVGDGGQGSIFYLNGGLKIGVRSEFTDPIDSLLRPIRSSPTWWVWEDPE